MDPMIKSLPAFQKAVTHYASYRLRVNIQFNTMKLIVKGLKNDISSVILVIDHKQKIEPVRYRESQVEYYGKKGMILLGMTTIRWKIGDNEAGYEYSCHDYVVKEYKSQNHIQVGAMIQLASRIINDNNLDIQSNTVYIQYEKL